MSSAPPLFECHGIDLCPGGYRVLQDFSVTLQPGLTWVIGGEGRGKTSLLRLMAGELQPQAGQVTRRAPTVCRPVTTDAALDAVPAQDWLRTCQAGDADWDARRATDLAHHLGLAEHLAKPLYMLSAGSRRKVGLVAAAASSADLILLDQPFAALDAASCQQLVRLLARAAQQSRRAWVVADYEVPPDWPAGVPDCRIELGD